MPARKLLFLLMLVLVALSACTPAPTAAPTAVPPTQAQATQAPTVTPPPSATPLPPTATDTPQPTATATASPTPIPPLAIAQSNSWCIPKDNAMYARAAENPSMMPEGAKMGEEKDGAISLITPALSCTFTFTFNQKAPEGARIEVLDRTGVIWLKGELIPSPQDPNMLYTVLTHSYLTEPPFWSILYPARVVLADGTETWTQTLNMNRGWVKVCWDGTLANVDTLYCKKQQDLHPWDPAYTPPPPK